MSSRRASTAQQLTLCVVTSLAACRIYDGELLLLTPDSGQSRSDTHPTKSSEGVRAAFDASVADANHNPRRPSIDARAADNDTDEAGATRELDAANRAPTEHDGMRVDSGRPGESDAANIDQCPGDTTKFAPGLCGCGVPENCSGLISGLVHRYRFAGTGTTLVDGRSAADGRTTSPLSGTSTLALSGASTSYATLPSGLLSALSTTTLEFWLTWQGGSARQRALSFGTALPNKPSATCTGNPDFFSGSWYQFCMKDGTMSWSKARGLCESAAGSLAAIETAAEDQYLGSHPAFTESVWIAANDLQTEGQWYFANQAGLQAGTHFWSGDEHGSAPLGAYQNWRTDQAMPAETDPNVDCAFIFKPNAKWTAWTCDYDGSFVCEWRGHQGASMPRGVFFTPADAAGLPALSVQLGASAVVARGTKVFPTNRQTHVALVLEPSAGMIELYVDGARVASAAISGELSALRDVDNWLGRSHVLGDPGFSGSIAELRIYDRALTAEELTTSFHAGTDPRFLE